MLPYSTELTNVASSELSNMNIKDLGRLPYRKAWDLQHQLVADLQNGKGTENLLLVEHNPVFTLGFHGNAANMLLDETTLYGKGIECIRIERGGDITYHGPGQLVAYPILNLRRHNLGVKAYVHMLEESVIRVLAEYEITAERDSDAPGVWLEVGTPRQRKICALGVKVSHAVTMHGLALNVNTDLTPFSYINPCGFVDKGVTTMAMELGHTLDFEEVKQCFADIFLSLLPIL